MRMSILFNQIPLIHYDNNAFMIACSQTEDIQILLVKTFRGWYL